MSFTSTNKHVNKWLNEHEDLCNVIVELSKESVMCSLIYGKGAVDLVNEFELNLVNQGYKK